MASIRMSLDIGSIATTVITAVIGLLIYEQVWYLSKKKGLPGPVFKIPIIGEFMASLHPSFESYVAKWKSGPLSCVSVFHRYVFHDG